jgi:hypothetical protein
MARWSGTGTSSELATLHPPSVANVCSDLHHSRLLAVMQMLFGLGGWKHGENLMQKRTVFLALTSMIFACSLAACRTGG